MAEILEKSFELLKTGEPLVVAGLFCGILAIGFFLGKGTRFAGKAVHKKLSGRKAKTSELLE